MSSTSVVRVFATGQRPDHISPWQSKAPDDGTGSGVVIGPGQVLTGAHVVADATFIQVQKVSCPDKFVARVHGICHDADLALLAVDAADFMEDIEPARIGRLPHFQDRVSVVGYPVGGDEISITEGVVSRIEVQRYAHSWRRLLAVTIDAAINEGNSGGPVLDEDGDVIGIAFQTLDDAENIGEMVPAPLITRFLEGVADGRPLDVPGLGVVVQNLENPALRRQLGLPAGESGILVLAVEHGSSAWGAIEPGDALLSMGGHDIANNGTIRFLRRYRTSFEAVLGQSFLAEALPVTLLRDGGRLERVLSLQRDSRLVPLNQYDRQPSWFVFGGFVFQVLTRDYLRTWDDWWDKAPTELLALYYEGRRTPQRQQVVVLTHVLADEINVGYTRFTDAPVASVDGAGPVDMADFVRRIDGAGEVVDIRLATGERIVLDTAEARDARVRILAKYRVPSDRSTDLA